MSSFGFEVKLDGAKAQLAALDRSAPFWTAYALTKCAQDVKAAEIAEMQRVFDRPTPWTRNALRVKPATKEDLVAVVDFKEFGGTPAWKYLGPGIEGGARRKKSHERALERSGIMRSGEFAVPGQGVALDAYGNMPGNLITHILSLLSASPDPTQNVTKRSKKRAIKRAGGQYFVLRGSRSAPDGIYQRIAADQPPKPVIIFVRTPRYQKRFPFYEIVASTAQTNFERHFWEAYRRWPPRQAQAAA